MEFKKIKTAVIGCVYNVTTSVERPAPFKPGYFENPELLLKI